uniref:Tick serine protease n=1 Tax=Rhipicephalus zambeziensis TaxID=60191 RepID=A0A224YR31_9ACAR
MASIMVKSLIGLSLLLITLDGLSAQMETINPEGCGVSFYKTMIVNGTEVKDAQYPWMVYLASHYPDGQARACGGTIITKRHILTAAHCVFFDNMYVRKVNVLYGSPDLRRGRLVEASKMLMHKGYDPFFIKNDIALVEVKYPFQFGKDVRPVCLQMAPEPIARKDAVATGWGSYYINGTGVEFLRQTTVTIYPDKICAMVFSGKKYSPGLQCCSLKRGTGVCSGDSGGPLMMGTGVNRFQQVGISSFVTGECGGYFPDVYTRVSGYANWITRGVSSSAGYRPLETSNAYM